MQVRKLQNSKKGKVKGFTLVELTITLLIGSILLAWGIPNYRDLKHRNQVTDSVNEMVYGLTLARAEAVRYGRNVRVVPIGGDWNNGWRLITSGLEGAADIRLYDQEPLPEMNVTGVPTVPIQFNSLGELVGGAELVFNVTHTNSSTTLTKLIRIGLTGQARAEDV